MAALVVGAGLAADWETVAYKLIDFIHDLGFEIVDYDAYDLNITSADYKTLLNGWRTFASNRGNAGRTFIRQRKSTTATAVNQPNTTVYQGDQYIHPTL